MADVRFEDCNGNSEDFDHLNFLDVGIHNEMEHNANTFPVIITLKVEFKFYMQGTSQLLWPKQN